MNWSGKRLAITGAGGFIGLRMAERALSLGMTVIGIDRAIDAVARAERAGVKMLLGDVCDRADVAKLCAGADVVFHAAAKVGEGGDFDEYRKLNVEATRIVAEAAKAAGVKKLVHLSSVMVYGFRFPRRVDEQGPLRGEGNPYCQTKIEGEREALQAQSEGGTDAIILRLGDVYGPRSIPWVVRPMELMKAYLFVLADGGRGTMNHLHVDNLIDCAFLALEKARGGDIFNVTDGAETSFRDYFMRLANIVGRRWLPSLPAQPLKRLFRVLERGSEIAGREPPARADAIDFVTRPYAYSIAKARRELAFAPRIALDEGIAEVRRWYRETSGTPA